MSNDWTLGSPTEIGKILFCDELSEDDPDIFGLGIIHCSLITSFCATKPQTQKMLQSSKELKTISEIEER